ncbi:MAG: transglutaminase-like domain-containing protein [Acidobacteriota bacterium]|nr:transglutaminase-like domain-containing protein [Acidobacteriota bacterium]
MNRIASLAMVCLYLYPVFAGEPVSSSGLLKTLLLDLYAESNTEIDKKYHARFQQVLAVRGLTNDQRADALLQWEIEGKLPEKPRIADETEVAAHILSLYRAANGPEHPVLSLSSPMKTLALFLGFADRLDGALDTRLDLPNLSALYELAVVKGTPGPAVCLNCRGQYDWIDRRTLLRVEDLGSVLPKSLHKLKVSDADPEKKLRKIARVLALKIRAEGDLIDYWQTPIETLQRKEGDCEDFAILFHAIAAWMDIPTQVVVGAVHQGVPRVGGKEHAWVEYRGRVIDPVNGGTSGRRYVPMLRFDARHAVFVEQNRMSAGITRR